VPSELHPQHPQLSTRLKIAIAAILLVTLAYSLIIAGQILLWFVLVGIAAGIYIAWLLVVAVFRMVEAVERIAAAMEADADDSGQIRDADDARRGDQRGGGAVDDGDD
jgi:hypothetical protein